ncbi:hypothetical protein [Streptomyces sp. bgisy027]|uniref:hypothetical protein n=1 Tax=Streptomyces sp. bgisy027 TaxID=3413770 RepID=UPI003D725507
MSRLLTALAQTGDAWDGTVAAIAATPRRVRASLAVRRHRRAALITAILTLVVCLFSIGDLAVSGSGRFTGAAAVRAAPDQLFTARAPYLFEPVLSWHPSSHVAVFISPVNLLPGAVVAALVGATSPSPPTPPGRTPPAAAPATPGSSPCFRHSCSASLAAYRPSCWCSVRVPPPPSCRS